MITSISLQQEAAVKYVAVPSGEVGLLVSTDSRAQNGKYFVRVKGMKEVTNHNEIKEITPEQYNAHTVAPSAKPAAKKTATKGK